MTRGFTAFLIAIMLLLIFWLFLVLHTANAAEIHGYFEAGCDLDEPEAYAEIMISLDFDLWVFQNSLYGGWETWFELPDEGIYMNGVIYDLYTIGYRVEYKQFYIKLQHEYRHPEEMDTSDISKSTISAGVKF